VRGDQLTSHRVHVDPDRAQHGRLVHASTWRLTRKPDAGPVGHGACRRRGIVPRVTSEASPAGLLAEVLTDAVGGRFPLADGRVVVAPPWQDGVEAVVVFTGHAVIATTLPLDAVLAAGADGFGGATLPPLLTLMTGEGGEVECLDVLLGARGTGGGRLPPSPSAETHPRAMHARHWRTNVRVHGDDRGLLLLVDGIAGLPQISYEVPLRLRGRGNGRSLLADGLALVDRGEAVLTARRPRQRALSCRDCPAARARTYDPGRRRRFK
jgi:hypothetical protein